MSTATYVATHPEPLPYTVARVKKAAEELFKSSNLIVKNICLEPLSLSTPEIVETSTTQGNDGRICQVWSISQIIEVSTSLCRRLDIFCKTPLIEPCVQVS